MKRFFSLLLCLLCFGCSAPESAKPKILVTIPTYAGFVKDLMEKAVDVEIFVPPGANPHTYEPTPEQIKHFTQAKVWFRIGDQIEHKMVRFLQEKDVQIIDLFAEEHPHSAHEHDLHVWMNPRLVAEQVKEMAAVLSKQFPEMATGIQERSQALEGRLQKLDAETATKLTPFKGDYLLVSHPAFGYFCERYELHQISIEIEGKDPLPQDIAQLMQELQNHPVPVILIEPQYNRKGALILAEKLKLPYEEIDPYVEDYFGMIQHLTGVIARYYDRSNS